MRRIGSDFPLNLFYCTEGGRATALLSVQARLQTEQTQKQHSLLNKKQDLMAMWSKV